MKVRIKDVEATVPAYLTPGKVYEVTGGDGYTCGNITDDRGELALIRFKGCAYLGGGDWEIVEDKPVETKPVEEPHIKPPLGIAPFNLWVEGRIVELTACIHREVSEGVYIDGRVTELQQLMDMRKLEFYKPFTFGNQEIKYAGKQT